MSRRHRKRAKKAKNKEIDVSSTETKTSRLSSFEALTETADATLLNAIDRTQKKVSSENRNIRPGGMSRRARSSASFTKRRISCFRRSTVENGETSDAKRRKETKEAIVGEPPRDRILDELDAIRRRRKMNEVLAGVRNGTSKSASVRENVPHSSATERRDATRRNRTKKKKTVVSTNFVRLNLKKRFRSNRKRGGSSKNRRVRELRATRAAFAKAKENAIPQSKRLYKDEGPDALDVCTKIVDDERKDEDTISRASEVIVPLCGGHQLPCTVRVVKKSTSQHKGRKFYACSLPREQQCDAFFWYDAVNRSDAYRILNSSEENAQSSDLRAARMAWFEARVAKMTCFELRRELKRLGERVGGKKEELSRRMSASHAKLLEWLDDEERMALARSGDAHALEQILRRVFGHEDWLPGQEEAVCRVVKNGESILLVLPTGGGKSLCYQLPALLGDGMTIVVSPLLSLMMDQLRKLPAALCGACIGSNQTTTETARVIDAVRRGLIQVLFVSPERLTSVPFQRLVAHVRQRECSISLVVVDEAHCVSEWSHNFRPSYLHLGSVIPSLCGSKTPILALTATVTRSAVERVQKILRLPPENVSHRSWRRKNLHIKVCRTRDRMEALSRVLKSVRLPGVRNDDGGAGSDAAASSKRRSDNDIPRWSCIVYALHRVGCEIIAKILRERGINAAAYHGKLPSNERRRVQERFVNGSLRVVVATTAFGMGLDKSDVRAVIHYNMPRSVESYVQEMGRAGRDGKPSLCMCLLEDDDARRLIALTSADGIDRSHLRSLMKQMFPPNEGDVGTKEESFETSSSSGREWWKSIEQIESEMDMSQASVETLVVLMGGLDIGRENMCDISVVPLSVNLCPSTYAKCKVKFHKTHHRVNVTSSPVAQVLLDLMDRRTDGDDVIDLRTLSGSLKMSSDRVLSELRTLTRRGVLTYELCDKCVRVLIMDEPTSADHVKQVEEYLWSLCTTQRERRTEKVAHLFLNLARAAASSIDEIFDADACSLVDRYDWTRAEEKLCETIDSYFEKGDVEMSVSDGKEGDANGTPVEVASHEMISEYEQKRLDTIARNEAALKALGLSTCVDEDHTTDVDVDEADLYVVDDLEGSDMGRSSFARVVKPRAPPRVTSRLNVDANISDAMKDEEVLEETQTCDSRDMAEDVLFLDARKHVNHIRTEMNMVIGEIRDEINTAESTSLSVAFALSSSRAVSRICHGIPSPAFPKDRWKSSQRWGKLKNFSVRALRRIASALLGEEDGGN